MDFSINLGNVKKCGPRTQYHDHRAHAVTSQDIWPGQRTRLDYCIPLGSETKNNGAGNAVAQQ